MTSCTAESGRLRCVLLWPTRINPCAAGATRTFFTSEIQTPQAQGTRVVGLGWDGWCFFKDGGSGKCPHGDAAGSESAVVSPTHEFMVFLGTCILERNHPVFEGFSASMNDVTEASGFIEAPRILLKRDVVPPGVGFGILFDPNTLPKLLWTSPMPQGMVSRQNYSTRFGFCGTNFRGFPKLVGNLSPVPRNINEVTTVLVSFCNLIMFAGVSQGTDLGDL